MKLVFAGTPDVAIPSLQALCDSEHEVTAVLTQAPAPSGRGRKLHASPVAEFALKRGIRILDPTRVAVVADELRELNPDCIPVVAYGQLIPAEMLSIPRFGWVNLHFSLLPAWRGAAPVQHAIWAGDQITGATTFILDSGMDTGPVLGTMTEVIRPADTSGELLSRLANAGAILLRQSIDALESGKLAPQPQSNTDVSYAPKIVKADAQINWNLPAMEVDRRIRATTPNPGAWTLAKSSGEDLVPLGIGPVRLVIDHEPTQPTQPTQPIPAGIVIVERKRVLVGTGSHPVELTNVTPAGRRSMPATDWARGLHLVPEFTS